MDWFRSLSGVLLLSYLGLLSLLVRSYMDTRFILVEDFSELGQGSILLWILGFTLIVGGWVWSLVAAARQGTRALYALLVYAVVCALWFGLGSLIQYADHVEELMIFGASLITGGLAAISTWLHLKTRRM